MSSFPLFVLYFSLLTLLVIVEVNYLTRRVVVYSISTPGPLKSV